MLRCLVRLRPPALLIACTPSGIRWAVASAWVARYGGIRSSCSVAALGCTMLRCLARHFSLCLQIASIRRCAFALRWFCFHETLNIYLFITYQVFIYFYLFIFAHDIARHCLSGFIDNMMVEKEYIRELDAAVSSISSVAVQIWLRFRFVQCCGVWHGCARAPALSLLMECTRPCTLVKLQDTAVPAPSLGLLG